MTIRALAVLAATTLLSNAGGSSSSEDLFRAIHRGDLAEVKKLIGRGAPINAKDDEGRTALMHAALYATSDCVKLLLAENADPNTIAPDGATALMYALPDPLKVRMLIEKGANVSAKLRDGKSVLMLAVKQDGAATTVRLLLSKGADPMAKDKDDGTTLMYAAQTGDVETVRLLIEKGVDVSAVAGPDFGKLNFGTLADRPRARTANRGGYTALMGAVSSRNSEAVKLLLDRGADPNTKLSFGFTPLFFAGPTCKPEIVSLLVGKGANVNVQEYRGATPLIRIAASDCLNASESARILLSAGADWRIRTEAGETALAWARKRGETEVVRVLKQAGANEETQFSADLNVPVDDVRPGEVRMAVEKSLALLQPSSVQFFRKAGCISCHHQSIASMAIAAARPNVAINEQMASQILKANLAVFAPHKDALLVADSGVPAPEIVASYALVAMAAEKYGADRLTDALVCDLAIRQHGDGHWETGGDRPPIASTEIESTALTMHALQLYGPPGRRPEFSERIAHGRAWLIAAPAVTLEEKAFRLLGLGWADADRKLVQEAVQSLASDQRANGGWAGLPTLQTDAYATGLALVGLRQGGNVPVNDSAYQRGVRYLVRTQLADGSWHVKSRALGFQPYFESGYPHEHDQWISSAGAGWSTIALSFALEPKQIAQK